ncbi:hypothetical protein BDF21DRAFT_397577 [Thamnidium elegans]|nr:hypothetical protein BDF21DRAFT_397577 [Thamnidium elegans]
MNSKNEPVNNKKEIKRKKSYFWNTTTIDNEKFSEKGGCGNIFQVKTKSSTTKTCLNTTATKQNLFSRLIKKMNSVLSKSSTSTAGQRSENKVKAERNIKYAQSMGQMQIVKPKQLKRIKSLLSHSVHPSHSKSNNNNDKSDGILTSLPYTLNGLDDKIEPSDWKTALMNELDAKQYEISNKSNLLKYRHGYNSDSNELVINTSQPSCIDNKKPNHHNLAAMEEKLGAISKKTMINDWLHYNSIPNSANTDMPITSYLQHYQYSDNQEMFSKKEFGHTTNQERLSILSAQLKKQGKQKHDHIKEKLDIAAARRNNKKI